MPGVLTMNLPDDAADARWADPGYFAYKSRVANAFRLIWQMVRPPRGHRTLPTKTGLLLILITLGIGTAAFNTSHNILYIALALLLSSLLLSGVMSWLNFKGCRWRLKLEPHWRAEEPTPVEVELSNTKTWLPTYGLSFRLCSRRAGAEPVILPLYGRLGPHETTEIEWLYTPAVRGREVLAVEGVQSKFPFGFLRKSIENSYERQVLVWPPRVSYTFDRKASRESPRSGIRRNRPGSGTELLNLRDYRPGDPMRLVHWKASARRQKLQVRELAEEGEANFCLLIATRTTLWPDDLQFERLCAFAGTLAEDLFMEGRLGAIVVNGRPPLPIRRLADLHGFLSELALLERVERAPTGVAPRPLVPLNFKPGNGVTVTCWIDGERVGEA